MPRRRFYRRGKRGFRKSYLAHLFEVDKASCGIGCLLGCPVVVLQNAPRIPMLDQGESLQDQPIDAVGCFETITDYLDAATREFKLSNGMLKYNYIRGVGANFFIDPSRGAGGLQRAMDFITYLYRYWVPALKHYRAYQVGSDIPRAHQPLVTAIEEAAISINKGNVNYIQLLALYNDVWNHIEVMTSTVGQPIFYPVHKLVGHRISNILRRCGVCYLIYPFSNQPMDQLMLKAGNLDASYSIGFLPNVGLKGMVKFIQRFNNDRSKVSSEVDNSNSVIKMQGGIEGSPFAVLAPNRQPNSELPESTNISQPGQ